MAEATTGERYCSFEEEEFFRKVSGEHSLHCPDCKERVTFRAGSRVPHFAHLTECNNPNPYSEPESITHRTGERHQYYLPETKQRADIIVIHDNGERWAFEYQCSKIPGFIWEERHQLYKMANVKDFWILDGSMIREREKGTSKLMVWEATYIRKLVILFIIQQIKR